MIEWVRRWQNSKYFSSNRISDPFLQYMTILHHSYFSRVYADLVSEAVDISGFRQTLENAVAIELGSAGGITKTLFPSIITSDVRIAPGVDTYLNAMALDLPSDSVDLIIAKDLLHHLPSVREHFIEIARVLKPNGVVVYIEPNWNAFSKLVFTLFHPEPFLPWSKFMEFTSDDPMYSNQALGYLLFKKGYFYRLKNSTLDFEIFGSTNGIDFVLSGGVAKPFPISSRILLLVRKHLGWLSFFHSSRYILVRRHE